MISGTLEENGLSESILHELSFKSSIGISLKKNLHYFPKEQLMQELFDMTDWYDCHPLLFDIPLDYRIKSQESIENKYSRYYPDSQVRKVFNDILGFRAFCDTYYDVIHLNDDKFKIVDMSSGKANDDGYRGVHLYYQIDNSYYPIEIQYNTLYDRQLNNWLHIYVYKQNYSNEIGKTLRFYYENGSIKNENDFKEVLDDVLFRS